jgi:hypothetical protein
LRGRPFFLAGFGWSNLVGRGIKWGSGQLVCSPQYDSSGSVYASACGFGCAEPAKSVSGVSTLYGQASQSAQFCRYGCPTPFNVSFMRLLLGVHVGFSSHLNACMQCCTWKPAWLGTG